jgi:hypothetical protein
MEGCEDMRFKSAIIELLAAEKTPPLNIHCCMQPVYGDKCVDVNTEMLGMTKPTMLIKTYSKVNY